MNGLAEYVRNSRLDDALTQEQFGKKVRLTSITISKIENGGKAGSKVLKNLSKYFNIPTRDLRRMNNERKEVNKN